MRICYHTRMGQWYLAVRLTRMWRRDCLDCGYYETYQG